MDGIDLHKNHKVMLLHCQKKRSRRLEASAGPCLGSFMQHLAPRFLLWDDGGELGHEIPSGYDEHGAKLPIEIDDL